jgi:hypothetical protein
MCWWYSVGDEILFYHEGGVDVGDVDAKASKTIVEVDADPSDEDLKKLISRVPASRQVALLSFIKALYAFYKALHYTYLEINPLVMTDDRQVFVMDLAAKVDETARFDCGKHWGKVCIMSIHYSDRWMYCFLLICTLYANDALLIVGLPSTIWPWTNTRRATYSRIGSTNRCIIKVDRIKSQRSNLVNGSWWWCKCYIC